MEAIASAIASQDAGHGSRNCFRVDFFYLNPDYECRAGDFLAPAFAQFPFAEYCYIRWVPLPIAFLGD